MREEFELELEHRIRNLMWTVSGDYTLDVKPDLDSFRRSRYIALYDGIKQVAFARYFDREELSLYLVKKIYLHASEAVSYTHLVTMEMSPYDLSKGRIIWRDK